MDHICNDVLAFGAHSDDVELLPVEPYKWLRFGYSTCTGT
jgi:hypothetical protein